MRNRTDHNQRAGVFITRANKIHNDKFDYSQVIYSNSYTHVKIICPNHGPFNITPKQHVAGSDCPICIKTHRRDTDARTLKFIETANTIHKYVYDYSKVHYINSYTPVEIICKIHGSFMQKPKVHNVTTTHERAVGCQQCATAHRNTNLEKFIRQSTAIHGEYYDYSLVSLVGTKDKVEIICPTHGTFTQIATQHMSGRECRTCARIKRSLTKEQFVERCRTTHGDKYDYTKTEYVNSHTKVKVTCPAHGEFIVDPVLHQTRTGCPTCSITYSRGNFMVKQYLQNHNIEFIEECRFDDCRSKYPLPFDFHIPSCNILVEFDGHHHYYPIIRGERDNIEQATNRFELIKQHDAIKNNYAQEKGIRLLRIPYTSMNKLEEILSDELKQR